MSRKPPKPPPRRGPLPPPRLPRPRDEQYTVPAPEGELRALRAASRGFPSMSPASESDDIKTLTIDQQLTSDGISEPHVTELHTVPASSGELRALRAASLQVPTEQPEPDSEGELKTLSVADNFETLMGQPAPTQFDTVPSPPSEDDIETLTGDLKTIQDLTVPFGSAPVDDDSAEPLTLTASKTDPEVQSPPEDDYHQMVEALVDSTDDIETLKGDSSLPVAPQPTVPAADWRDAGLPAGLALTGRSGLRKQPLPPPSPPSPPPRPLTPLEAENTARPEPSIVYMLTQTRPKREATVNQAPDDSKIEPPVVVQASSSEAPLPVNDAERITEPPERPVPEAERITAPPERRPSDRMGDVGGWADHALGESATYTPGLPAILAFVLGIIGAVLLGVFIWLL